MENINTGAPYIIETSWEVCNKVGGIYAVLSTKARTLHRQIKDKLMFIGPDLWTEENPSPCFKEQKSLLLKWRKASQLPEGVKVRVGRWDVPGKPIAILVDYKSLEAKKNELYSLIWEEFGVDSLHAYGDYDESCLFAYGAALVVESLSKWLKAEEPESRVIAHFDEWTTGMGLLYVKHAAPEVATVFTTHATCIGRSICGNGKDLYDYMPGYNGDQMSRELNMESKHSLEKTAAREADAFTTVSEVTQRECKQLLEVEPFVTPNAFEQDFVPKGQAMKSTRAAARKKLIDMASARLGEDLADDTMLVGTSGRHEYRNKGLDLYLDVVNVCRDRMAGNARKVVFFVMVPAWVKGAREDLVEAMAAGKLERMADPVISHEIFNYDSDMVYCKMKALNLNNAADENVKVIYMPSYLNGNDGVVNMPYYDVITGLDMSIFGSYYEPWGYTPMESVAFGVPTVTTDLAGFGQWVLGAYGDDTKATGVKVVHRTDSNYDEVLGATVDFVNELYSLEAKATEKLRAAAQRVAKAASWDNFVEHYWKAYEAALAKCDKRDK